MQLMKQCATASMLVVFLVYLNYKMLANE